MHVLHLLFTEADSVEHAREKTVAWCDNYLNAWFDWYEIGGRWNGFLADYQDGTHTDTNVVQITEQNKEPLLTQLRDRQQQRWAELTSQLTGVGLAEPQFRRFVQETAEVLSEQNLSNLDPEDARVVTSAGMWFYHADRCEKLLTGQWYFDSGCVLVNSQEYSASRVETIEKAIDNSSGTFWAVAVDFHF